MLSFKKESFPTWITLSRILLTFPVVYFILNSETALEKLAAALIFLLASFTDYLDGYFARKWQAVSDWGKFFDPVADKILVSSVLVAMAATKLIDPYMVMIILARDNYIGALRASAALENLVIDAKPAGKWKTAIQMIALPLIILKGLAFMPDLVFRAAYFALWLSVILSITSGLEYQRSYLAAARAKKGGTKSREGGA